MEQFIASVESYCRRCGIEPERLLRAAINADWGRWQRWRAGTASPRIDTIERISAYMAANPPAGDAA